MSIQDVKKTLKASIDDAVNALADKVDELTSSELFTNYLKTLAKFHNYSWHNTMLILSQFPTAQRVAGFRAWQKLGRCVRKGEHAIRIFAPMHFTKEKPTGELENGLYFRIVNVFDISQTDGDELPDVPIIHNLISDENEYVQSLLADTMTVAHNQDRLVEFLQLKGRENGYAERNGDHIVISTDLKMTSGQQAETLVHELAHANMHFEDGTTITAAQAETEAQAVAHVVCQRFGLGTEINAANYIASHGTAEMVRESLKRISHTARKLITELEDAQEAPPDFAAATTPVDAPAAHTEPPQPRKEQRMPEATTAVSEDVLAVLSAATIKGYLLTLNNGQLDRKMYVAVNKVLEAMGGKWSRKEKGHIFNGCPIDLLDTVILTKMVTNSKKAFQAFYTPAALAQQLVELADIQPHDICLEPSAGDGALIRPIKADRIDYCELDPDTPLRHSTQAQYLTKMADNFLQYDPGPIYDKIVANPPFTRQQDIAHVSHMIECCKPGGRIVTIMSPGFTFRQDRKTVAFREALEACRAYEVTPVPAGAFKESGTMVSTVIVCIDK